MSTLFQPAPRSPFGPSLDTATRRRSMAVIPQEPPSPKSGNGPDIDMSLSSPPPSAMGPPAQNSPEDEHLKAMANGNRDQNHTPTPNSNAAAVGAAQGPKVVQTAFIHKLYSMLEDRTISHLISWSNNNDSFVMSPSNEFSKVLAQYFKHTNVSSFVRQLNMYGFHKVSDVFHTGSPEAALWEFKHGNGNFKKGDLMGLREIKRRASRHTLIHRDSFPAPPKPPGAVASQPGTPAEVMPDTDQRVAHLEFLFNDVHARLSRTEESHALLNSRCQALTDSLSRCHQWMQTFGGALQNLAPQESAMASEISNMQKEIGRQLEYVRALEQPAEPMMNGGGRSLYSNIPLEPPISPRGYNYPDSRRSSVQIEPQHVGLTAARPPVPPIPAHFATSPRRFGSISGGSQPSPGFSRPPLPPQQPHPLSSVATPDVPPSLARRHTSADIREHGWPLPPPPEANNHAPPQPPQWQPPSPPQPPIPGDQHIRDQLASYSINGPRRPDRQRRRQFITYRWTRWRCATVVWPRRRWCGLEQQVPEVDIRAAFGTRDSTEQHG
ncbi:Transcription factor SFL1 [Cyphellophora attinorum]|uniref:Transcription factor SFL1 n=1 Tax=Cyphellophora attinorum TaxID=1664694 RepID=A0A0N0NPN9_9EURO|nr:Transcription factor SFL1 [Phialophora attinorum]KPI42971.1 Transcription factor SFL1 [Phialophora attinorum]